MRRYVLVGSAVIVAAAACGYYDASLLAPRQDAGAGGGGGSPSVCEHAGPPPSPTMVDGGGDLDFTLALYQISFGNTDGGALPGYDIDRTCTCQGENDSCLRASWATAKHCDLPGGRDNASGDLMKEMASYVSDFSDERFNTDLRNGVWNTISRVRYYNGQPDDDNVEISWYVAIGFGATNKDGDGGKATPKWDGKDEWPISSVSLEGTALPDGGMSYDLDRPISVDKHGYVSGGIVVGMLPKGILQLDSSLKLVFSDLYLTGRLVNTPQGMALEDGVIAGVWTLEDIFSQLGHMEILGLPTCIGSPPYPLLKTMICKRTDIYRGRGTPTTLCDSLSVGLTFSARPMRMKGILAPNENPNFCTPETDPSNDACDKP